MSTANSFLPFIDNNSHFFFSYNLLTGKFSYINTAFSTFFGATQETDPLSLAVLLHPEDMQYVIAKIKDSVEGEHLEDIQTRVIIRKQNFCIRISAAVQTDEFGAKELIGMIKDITTETDYISTLLRHNTRKNGILNILAHDLAGPIGVIDSISDLLKKETSDLHNDEVDNYISIISKTSKSCTNLIREFIGQEFLESAEVNLLKSRIDLVQAVRVIIEQYQSGQEESGKRFDFDTKLDHLYVEIDHDKFMQVIHNLISNAMKFTGVQGIIRLGLQANGDKVLLTVSDNGIGIPEQFHDVLFDKFTKARRPGLNGEISTGLGMSIIKTIVEWHDGKITFTSNGDDGTTFYIQLPKL